MAQEHDVVVTKVSRGQSVNCIRLSELQSLFWVSMRKEQIPLQIFYISYLPLVVHLCSA